MANETITAVPGIRVGHAAHARGGTGCTVVLGPFRGACDVRGHATGTREIDTLSPSHLVPLIDAVLLTGGSAFGLAAADGVTRWIAEQGGGFDTGVARVPIVPAAVIFDLTNERNAPDASLGRAACEAASDAPVREGRMGAGIGATFGKLRGRELARPGGIGSFAMRSGDYTFGALVVVNAVGDVIGDGENYTSSLEALATAPRANVMPASNTTLAVVATDAPLSRLQLQILARAASSAFTRRIAPAHTLFDGDVVFALSTSKEINDVSAYELLSYGAVAQLTLEHAILRAVK